MNRFTTTCVSLFYGFVLAASAQPVNNRLMGIVTQQSSGRRPVAEVEIRSEFANVVRSGHDGRFTLTFQNRRPGDPVNLTVKKIGWEVVNNRELETILPDNPRKVLFQIVLSPAGRLSESRLAYYHIAKDFLDKQYKQRFIQLNRKISGWEQRVAQLEEERQILLQKAQQLADTYSRVNYDDLSEFERKNIALFKQGKIQEVISRREQLHSERELTKIADQERTLRNALEATTANLKRLEKAKKEQIANLFYLADEYALNFQFNKAIATLNVAVKADTTLSGTRLKLAGLLANQLRYDSAIYWYSSTRPLLKTAREKADLFNNLGNVYQRLFKMDSALVLYQDALRIYQDLVQVNDQLYRPDLARTLTNMGGLYLKTYRHKLALEAYQQSLQNYQHIVTSNPGQYDASIALLLNSIGSLYTGQRSYRLARNCLDQALAIQERLARQSLDSNEAALAGTFINLGDLFHSVRQLDSSEIVFLRAKIIYEKLARQNPDAYQPYVALAANNLGVIYKRKQKIGLAFGQFKQALVLQQQLADRNPVEYKQVVARSLSNLGTLYAENHQLDSALATLQQTLGIYEQLVRNQPAAFEPNLATTLENLGNVYGEQNRYGQARGMYRRALEIQQRLIEQNPAVFELDFCKTMLNSASLDYRLFIKQGGAELLGQINDKLTTVRPILDRYQTNPMAVLSQEQWINLHEFWQQPALFQMVDALQKQVDQDTLWTRKISKQKILIDKRKELIAGGASRSLYALGTDYGQLSWALINEKRFKEAELAALAGIDLPGYKKPANYDAGIDWIRTNLAHALLLQNRFDEAKAIYLSLKDKRYDQTTYKEVFLEDFGKLEKKGINHPDVSRIRRLIQ